MLITAATALASDSDPARFANRPESRFTQHYMFDNSPWLGSFGNALSGGGLLYDKVVLRTFTYSSFVDSRQFFQAVPPSPPAAPGH